MSAILSIDQGTTRTTAAVIDAHGRILAKEYSEVRSSWPKPGWVEQDPTEIWDGVLRAVRGSLDKAETRVSGVALTGQRESALLWMDNGEPASPVIVWQDRRTTAYVEQLRRRGASERVHELTGLVLDPYFSAPLLHWLLHDDPQRTGQPVHFGNPVSWMLYKLTGIHAVDVSNAARTLLFDLRKRAWCEELLELFEIPAEVLPPVVDCVGEFGLVSGVKGLEEVPVVAMVGDMQAGLIGAGGGREGVCKVTYGTAGNAGLALGQQPILGSTVPVTVEYAAGGQAYYCAEGNVFVVGGALEWLKRMGVLPSVAHVDNLATPLPEESQLTVVPAFAGLATPFWEPRARAAVFGLDLSVTRGHLIHAMLEGIGLRVQQCLDAFQDELAMPVEQIRADGGAARSGVLMQLQADLSGLPVERLVATEGAALGAAFLGFFGLGVYDAEDLASPPLVVDRFEPQRDTGWRESKRRRFAEAVGGTLEAAAFLRPSEVAKAT